MRRLELAQVARGTGEPALGETFGRIDEPVPRLFALPDFDDANALVRTSRGVEDQPLGRSALEIGAAKRS